MEKKKQRKTKVDCCILKMFKLEQKTLCSFQGFYDAISGMRSDKMMEEKRKKEQSRTLWGLSGGALFRGIVSILHESETHDLFPRQMGSAALEVGLVPGHVTGLAVVRPPATGSLFAAWVSITTLYKAEFKKQSKKQSKT